MLKDEIVSGIDELGVLLMGHARGAYWYGSQLSIDEARALCPHNSATSLQVAASVMAGVLWAIANPARDVVEPDDLPFDECCACAGPTSATSSASTATGPRSPTGDGCSRRTSIATTPGSSRTFASPDPVHVARVERSETRGAELAPRDACASANVRP